MTEIGLKAFPASRVVSEGVWTGDRVGWVGLGIVKRASREVHGEAGWVRGRMGMRGGGATWVGLGFAGRGAGLDGLGCEVMGACK